MKKQTTFLCLILAFILFSATVGESADLKKGADAHYRGDYATALREWKPLARRGDARAQYFLGGLYYHGNGVLQNYKTAAKWYSLAAKKGHPSAQFALAGMYLLG